MEIITSATNRIVKEIRALHDKKGRVLSQAFLAEGAKFVAEIGKNWDVRQIVVSESYAKTSDISSSVVVVADRVFAGLSDVIAPQGIMAIVRQRNFSIEDMLSVKNPLIFMLDDINDPGNLGTILRNCHGLGVSGVVLSPRCTDVYSPKVIRASAGSIFHLPFVVMDLVVAAGVLRTKNIPVYATKADGDNNLYNLDLRQSAVFVLGNEHHGVSKAVLDIVDNTVKIPTMSESLNVSVAGAIIAYEVLRQRVY
ncbi:MAG: RNA methyltransferase [Defluviitaleaceae bacterium]|nr:RNA methyltransferase [Defluviitaleaceae bacterium]